MWKLAAPAAALAAALMAFSSSAMASTNTSVKMSFAEPIIQDINSGCPALGLPDGGFCGAGAFVPYGHATETIAFGAGCNGGCDLRTVSVVGGSLVLDETFSNSQCPGSCHPNPPRTRQRNADRCDRQRDRHLLRGERHAHRRGNRCRPAESCPAFRHHRAGILSTGVHPGSSVPGRGMPQAVQDDVVGEESTPRPTTPHWLGRPLAGADAADGTGPLWPSGTAWVDGRYCPVEKAKISCSTWASPGRTALMT